MNRATLYGNVGGDPEIKTMASGDRVANFSLATSDRWKDKDTGEQKETTEWHRIVCFNQGIVGVIEKFVKKGSKLLIEAKIKTRKYQDQAGNDRYATEIVIERFGGSLQLCGQPQGVARDESSYGTTTTRQAPQGFASPAPGSPAGQGARAPIDDDIPF